MAILYDYLPQLRANEGGYCNTPGDHGGETYRGVSRVDNPDWPGWVIVDSVKEQHDYPDPVPYQDWASLSAFLENDASLGDDVITLYETNYWSPLQLSAVTSQDVANQLMDHGVNTGPPQSAKMVQYLLNVKFGASLPVDAAVGPLTLAAINQADSAQLYQYFAEMRQSFYFYLADCTPNPPLPDAASWDEFIRNDLGLEPQASQRKFLNSWLSRTQEPYAIPPACCP